MPHILFGRAGSRASTSTWRLVFVVPGLWALLAFTLATPSGASPFEVSLITSRLAATVTAALVLPSFLFAAWYVVASNPADKGVTGLLLVNHIAAALTLVWTWLWVAGLGAQLWGHLAQTALDPHALFVDNRPLIFAVGLASYVVAILGYYLLVTIDARQHEALRREELLKLAKDAELRALEFQINPHFLFNSLNSISALTTAAPQRARDMCVRLGGFLRRTLDLGDRSSVTLRDELDLVSDYLEIEEIRFEDRLRVTRDIDETCLDDKVPTLILQPLVENAIKHGLGSLLGPMDLEIRAQREAGGALVVDVINACDPTGMVPNNNPRKGVGLVNTRERLARQFGSQTMLSARLDGEHFRVTLTIPQDHATTEGEAR